MKKKRDLGSPSQIPRKNLSDWFFPFLWVCVKSKLLTDDQAQSLEQRLLDGRFRLSKASPMLTGEDLDEIIVESVPLAPEIQVLFAVATCVFDLDWNALKIIAGHGQMTNVRRNLQQKDSIFLEELDTYFALVEGIKVQEKLIPPTQVAFKNFQAPLSLVFRGFFDDPSMWRCHVVWKIHRSKNAT